MFKAAVLLAGALGWVCCAQKAEQKIAEPFRTLIDESRGLPPEFAADGLIRLSSAKELSVAVRRQLLLDASEIAAQCQYSFPKRNLPGYEVDTPDGYLAKAFDLNLDELSLKARAVTALAAIDPAEARRLFDRMQGMRLSPASCGVRLTPDLTPLYKVGRLLSATAFNAKEKEAGDDIAFLTRLIYGAWTPAQVRFIPGLVGDSTWLDDDQFPGVLGAVTASLGRVDRDEISFRVYFNELANGVSRLADLCTVRRVSNLPLLTAYRGLLIQQLSGERCDRLRSQTTSFYASAFGKMAEALYPANATLAQLTEDDVTPSSMVKPPESEESYFRSEQSLLLLTEFRALREERKSPAFNEADWQQHVAVYLSALKSWNSTEESSERTYLHEKSILYKAVRELELTAEVRRAVVRDNLAFLEESRFRNLGIEWYWHVKELLPALEQAGFTDEALKDPILALYGQLKAKGL